MTVPLARLIDANIVSGTMRPQVAAFPDAIEAEGIGLASITVWEILDRIGHLAPGKRRRGLANGFHDLLDELFEDRIVAWTLDDARARGSMEGTRRRGEALDDHVPDASLAAAADTRGFAVVTRNRAEFRNTGVETVDHWTLRQS